MSEFKVGDKIHTGTQEKPFTITAIGEQYFLLKYPDEDVEICLSRTASWQLYQEPEEKKTKLVSPAITNSSGEGYWRMTNALWEDGEENPMTGFKWPARVVLKNARLRFTGAEKTQLFITRKIGNLESMQYEFPNNGTEVELDGDLFFEVPEK